jgi:ATP-binding cassette subfamily B protein
MTSPQYRNLWALTRGQRRRYAYAIVALAAANLFMFGAPLVAKYGIDAVVARDLSIGPGILLEPVRWLGFEPGFAAYLSLSALAILLLTAAGGYCQYLRGRLAATASESIARSLREELYRRLHHLWARFYDEADTGDLVQRCSSDVETLRVFLSADIVEIGRAVLLLATVTPILFWLDARLAAASLAILPLLVVFAYVFFTKVKQVFEITDVAEGEMTTVMQENLTGLRVVRAFARQNYEIAKFAAKNAAFRDYNHRLIRLMGLYWSSADLLAMTQMGLVLFLGAYWIMQGSLSVGTLFAFMTYEAMVMWPVRQLGRVLTDSGKAVVSLKRVNEILTSPEESLEPAPAAGRADGEIRFERVTFGYDPNRPVLHDFTLHVRAGETLAIVGAPGAGKSTLIRLLLRLYGHQQGRISIDGRDVSSASRQWLRHQIGVVLQDPFLYSRTVEANLRVGRPDATYEHLELATRDAAIHDSIERFADGYQTLVGERGVTLSGGQRQRLALARALIKDPPILVLDDSLSAVDTGTEAHILASLRRRKGRHTTIVIAHRLASVRHADRILVLERGRCVQLGDHHTLAGTEGPYRRLWEIQGELDTQIIDDMLAVEVEAH